MRKICIFAQISFYMEIDKKLYSEIKQYCELNNLKITHFVNEILRKAFNIEKYGNTPFCGDGNNASSFITKNEDMCIKQKENDVIKIKNETKKENLISNYNSNEKLNTKKRKLK